MRTKKKKKKVFFDFQYLIGQRQLIIKNLSMSN